MLHGSSTTERRNSSKDSSRIVNYINLNYVSKCYSLDFNTWVDIEI